jgi:hypothetical protein
VMPPSVDLLAQLGCAPRGGDAGRMRPKACGAKAAEIRSHPSIDTAPDNVSDGKSMPVSACFCEARYSAGIAFAMRDRRPDVL